MEDKDDKDEKDDSEDVKMEPKEPAEGEGDNKLSETPAETPAGRPAEGETPAPKEATSFEAPAAPEEPKGPQATNEGDEKMVTDKEGNAPEGKDDPPAAVLEQPATTGADVSEPADTDATKTPSGPEPQTTTTATATATTTVQKSTASDAMDVDS